MEISLKEHGFSGEEPIRVIDFLARFVREATIQGMTEAQSLIVLTAFLTGFPKSQFEAGIQMVAPEEDGVSRWPEAVRYLIRNYDQSTPISTSINELRAVRQSHSETENSFSKRINDSFDRCGNVHSGEEVLTLFIDGLEPTTPTVVGRHRESHRRSTYLEIVQYSTAEGDAVRARSYSTKPSGQPPSRVIPVHLIKSPSDTTAPSYYENVESTEKGNLIQDAGWQLDLQSSSVPSGSDVYNVMALQKLEYR